MTASSIEINMSTIFLTQPPFIVNAGPCPGVYASAEAYHGYLQMKGIEPMTILTGFPPSNTISPGTRIHSDDDWLYIPGDTEVTLRSETVPDDPIAGPGQDAEWDTIADLTLVVNERDYGNGRNISFRKRAGNVVSLDGKEIPAETGKPHNV
jgi:hypothetical protein